MAVTQEEITEVKERYWQTSAAYYLQGFVNGIASGVDTQFIPTGFNALDRVLDGGLTEGLYILGAIPSLGKTTLVCQIADQIARGGHDVLIFSLEMSRYELMAKSISRLTVIDVEQNAGDRHHMKTARGITTGSRYKNYSEAERVVISRAIGAYAEFAHRLYIIEGVGDVGAAEITERVQLHIEVTGNSPVVIVDYQQILAPYSEKATDKQNTDKSVLELKRLARDCKIPIVALSSVNRATYSQQMSMEAFKESGAIEYGSDVLIGLQLMGVGGNDFDVNTAKRKTPREVELVILKNRNGAVGDKIALDYYPAFNYFEEKQRP